MRRRKLESFTLIGALMAFGAALLSAQRGTAPAAGANDPTIVIDKPMPAPAWALAERALLRINAEGAAAFSRRYLDERGYLRAPERWGVSDGPDDAMETIRNWPLAHALGGSDSILTIWEKAWEGNLEQYSRASIPSIELAKNGMYYKEFITSFDWEHTSEALAGFYFYGLSRPVDERYQARLRRFSGFYMNEDPEAPNYDAKHKIIRSLFNGSKGPKLTPATVDDWDGEEVPGANPARRTRFLKSSNIRGDHPLNLNVAMLHLHAYMLTHEAKYRDWLLEYVNAWRERTEKNGGNIPSNVGLDGAVGGEWGGKWYGGVFGWNSPDTGIRNYVLRGPPEAFSGALLLTGDQAYTQVLRRQIDNLYAAKQVKDGKILLPRFYGDQGWYGFHEVDGGPSGSLGNLGNVLTDIYMWSLAPGDLERLPKTGWIGYLNSRNPDYPLAALQEDLEAVRRAAQRLRNDGSSFNIARGSARGSGASPVATTALINLTMGGNDPGGSTHGPLPLHTQVRHFDPERRRAGLPEDVGALVERIAPESVTLTLVNLNPLEARTLTVQMGAYAEHHATSVTVGGRTTPVDRPWFHVRLAPGAGETLTIAMRRYVHQPTLAFPWDRGWMVKR
jgi:hypothetical protein